MLPLSQHARFEMKRRSIAEEEVEAVFRQPEQKIKLAETREIWQNKIEKGGKTYVYRVVIELKPELKIITVYKSSKVKKYWRENS